MVDSNKKKKINLQNQFDQCKLDPCRFCKFVMDYDLMFSMLF